MTLLELNPFDVHFGDGSYETALSIDEAVMRQCLLDDLVLSIQRNGVVDPIIVYAIDRNPYLYSVVFYNLKYKPPPSVFWCWRGTQRLRAARILKLPKIKALWLDEPVEYPLLVEKVQQYYKKPIRIFVEERLQRWDVLGVYEDGTKEKNTLY